MKTTPSRLHFKENKNVHKIKPTAGGSGASFFGNRMAPKFGIRLIHALAQSLLSRVRVRVPNWSTGLHRYNIMRDTTDCILNFKRYPDNKHNIKMKQCRPATLKHNEIGNISFSNLSSTIVRVI